MESLYIRFTIPGSAVHFVTPTPPSGGCHYTEQRYVRTTSFHRSSQVEMLTLKPIGVLRCRVPSSGGTFLLVIIFFVETDGPVGLTVVGRLEAVVLIWCSSP